MAPTSTVLNDDCWALILDYFNNDFAALAKILQVSRQLLAITAPRLYGQLGHPVNEKQIGGWSYNKQHRVTALLLAGSGFLNPTGGVNSASLDRRQSIEFLPCHQYVKLKLPSYQLPLLADYFGYLKRLPPYLCGQLWCSFTQVKKDNFHKDLNRLTFEYAGQHARVLTELEIGSGMDIDLWLPWAEQLSQLTIITIRFLEPMNAKHETDLTEMIRRHLVTFPGLLTEIMSANISHAEFVLKLNTMIKPKRLHLWSFKGLETQLEVEGEETTRPAIVQNIKEFKFEEMDGTKLTANNPSATKNLSRFLQKCRKVETIEMDSWAMGETAWTDLFTWAKQELRNAIEELEQRQDQQSEIQQPLSSLDSLLVQLKSFSSFHLPEYIGADVIDAFRFSLETLDFRGTHSDRVMGSNWSWPLCRLTVLRLRRCAIMMSNLHHCPILEELHLEDVHAAAATGNIQPTWKCMKSLKVLRLVRGHAISVLELQSIGTLENLEELELEHDLEYVAGRLEHMGSLNWKLPKLKQLTLSDEANSYWQRIFLRLAPNLESFSSSESPLAASQGWWFETGSKSYFRIVTEDEDNDKEIEDAKLDSRPTIRRSAAWNAVLSKIRYLNFGGSWNFEDVVHFKKFLLVSKVFVTPTNGSKPFTLPRICVPDLSHVVLPFMGGVTDRTQVDQLLLVLMKRPKMRWIESSHWNQSKQFVEEKLQKLDRESIPAFASMLSGYEDEMNVLVAPRPCILSIIMSGRGSIHYRLRDE